MATKKVNAATEETANTAELHENDAQRVEAPEAEGNIPTEEKTQETAKFEQIDEGEALTLDSIEDLTLPGDMELDSEQPRQRWRITDDGCADWALKKIKAEKDELERLTALADKEIARLKEQVEKAQRRYEQNTKFLTSMLAEFFKLVPHKKTKTGTESYRLLNGQLVMKPATVKIQPDDEKLVEWLRDAGHEDLIKVTTSPKWAELKKQITLVGSVAMIEATGEIVEGVSVTDEPAAFSVKF